MEIERKFLFHKLPDQLDTYPHYGIEQAYVTTNPVIRVRKKTLYDAASAVSDCQYVLTVKSSGMLAKQEFITLFYTGSILISIYSPSSTL